LNDQLAEERANEQLARSSGLRAAHRGLSSVGLTLLILILALSICTAPIAGASSPLQLNRNSSENVGNHRSPNPLNAMLTGFSPTLGATRTQVEQLFHFIDKNTTFKAASKVEGVPRVLGQDKSLYTAVEINGYPEVIDVQVVSILDTASKTVLDSQVAYLSLTCREFSTKATQKWCTGRILNTNSSGLVTATKSMTIDGLRFTVRTYRSITDSGAPVVSIDVSAI
jgi:hypothetical protein